MSECIIGWAHTPFGKLEQDAEALIAQVATEALAHAAVEPKDIDAIFVGQFNNGLVPQDFPSSLVMSALPALRFKPATRVENACATGSAAIHAGMSLLAARRARHVLVIGVEKMTSASAEQIAATLLGASYHREEGHLSGGFVGIFAEIAQRYTARFGDVGEALALIAAKNHQNGAANPLAHLKKPLTVEFCREASQQNPYVVTPLKRTDCSPVSDGAAAIVLSTTETAHAAKRQVGFRAAVQVNDLLPMSKRDIETFPGAREAWRRAYTEARAEVSDLSFVETHDCFTIAELIEYEAMGLSAEGRGAQAIKEGWTRKDGKLPVNPSGGLKAKGHPVGATGVSMHVMAAMQLCGEAPAGLQLPAPRLGGVFNMGGASVANYVSILERLR